MNPQLQQQYDALNPVYQPQEQLIQQQIASLPGQAEAQKSALEQARVNAFKTIDSNARGRGVYFSGYRPQAQGQFTGEKYLPALAGISSDQANQTSALQQALLGLRSERGQLAQGNLNDILNRQQQQKQFQQEQAQKAQIARQQQADRMALAYAGSQSTPVDPYEGFNASVRKSSTNKDTGEVTQAGTSFTGPGNQPITAFQYYTSTGTGLGGLSNFLRTDMDPTSQKAYQELQKVNQDVGRGIISQADGVKKLTDRYPWIFGG